MEAQQNKKEDSPQSPQKPKTLKKLDLQISRSNSVVPPRLRKLGLIQNIRDQVKAPLYRVCLTGGPCAGKTSAMKQLQKELKEEGFTVYIVPEIPTITAEGGGLIQMGKMDEQQIINFQANLIQFQMAAEDYFLRIALMQEQPAVVLCDRGTCDPMAYVSQEQWQVILDQEGWNSNTLRDFRYDAVIHLVTAAIGAEKFYGHDNKARYEVTQLICSSNFKNIEQAREADKKVLNAYVGHPHHLIIDNQGNFKEKLKRVATQLKKVVGLGYDKTFNRSYLVTHCNRDYLSQCLFSNKIWFKTWKSELTLLTSSSKLTKEYIQKRGVQNFTYEHIFIDKKNNEQMRQEQCTAITPYEYKLLSENIMKGTHKIVAQVVTFNYNLMIFNVKFFQRKHLKDQLVLLHLETDKDTKDIKFPIFLKVTKEVTEDEKYSSEYICKCSEE